MAQSLILIGLLVTLSWLWLVRHRTWPEQAALAFLYIAIQLALYAAWRWISSRTQCPQCSSPRARLSYDDKRDEYLTCDACGLHQPTGMSQPDD